MKWLVGEGVFADRYELLDEVAVLPHLGLDPGLEDPPRLPLERRADHGVGAHGHVALAHLLRVVEGMAVEEGPQELPGDAPQRELEVRVLEGRVMPGVEDGLRDPIPHPIALLRGFLFQTRVSGNVFREDDAAGRVARTGGRDGVLVGPLEGVYQPYVGSRVDEFGHLHHLITPGCGAEP